MPIELLIMRALGWLINIAEIAIWAEVILSFFPNIRSSFIYSLVETITRPILLPIRFLLNKSSIANKLPIDFAPFFGLILLGFLRQLLG